MGWVRTQRYGSVATAGGHVLLAARSGELCDNLTAYDASYVALAEAWEVPLVTLDRRIAGAPGIRCEVRESVAG